MRILVCGDRNWSDGELIRQTLMQHPASVVIQGECRGADKLGKQAAYELGIPYLSFPAQWDQYGGSAGPIRNKQILVEGEPDLVLAFHDDLESSKGTRNMVSLARKAGVPVEIISHS